MGLNFVAVDFETANTSRDSPCAIGITRVEDGSITKQRVELFQPPIGQDANLSLEEFFNPFCMRIHGITPEAVKNKPRFEDIWPDLYESEIKGRVVVAHNANFDIGVMRQAIERAYLTNQDSTFAAWPEVQYFCTLVLARRVFDLASYALPFVAEAANVTLGEHHAAGDDARAAAEILLSIAEARNAHDLDELVSDTLMRYGTLKPLEWAGCRADRTGHTSDSSKPIAASPNPDADPNHPLYDQVIAFTGMLGSMTRQDAFDHAARVGAVCEANVTKHTNILVLGTQDASRLRPGSKLSSKARKAFQLVLDGQAIEVMEESDFLALISDTQTNGIRITN